MSEAAWLGSEGIGPQGRQPPTLQVFLAHSKQLVVTGKGQWEDRPGPEGAGAAWLRHVGLQSCSSAGGEWAACSADASTEPCTAPLHSHPANTEKAEPLLGPYFTVMSNSC